MPDNTQQTTITVKKSDGTLVKMTMDEFRAYKASMKQKTVDPNLPAGTQLKPNEVATPNVEPIAKIDSPQTTVASPNVPTPKSISSSMPSNLPMVEESQALTSSTPVIVGETVKSFAEPAPQAASKPVTFSSPLEEESVSGEQGSVSSSNQNSVDEIIQSILFLVGEDQQEKLKSLVLSRVKEVRTDVQVKEMAQMSVESGGLGLDETKVTILMNAISHVLTQKPAAAPLASAKGMLSPVPQTAASASSTPITPAAPSASQNKPIPAPTEIAPSPIFINKKPDAQKIISSLIAEDAAEAQMKVSMQNRMSPQKIPTMQRMETGKVIMHDVVVAGQSMGPIDEMLNCSLLDFRRLGATPNASADVLIKKFQILKAESFLLFLQGRAAWFKSPLYLMYLDLLEQSLHQRKTISILLGMNKDTLTMEEIQETARVSQSLNF